MHEEWKALLLFYFIIAGKWASFGPTKGKKKKEEKEKKKHNDWQQSTWLPGFEAVTAQKHALIHPPWPSVDAD